MLAAFAVGESQYAAALVLTGDAPVKWNIGSTARCCQPGSEKRDGACLGHEGRTKSAKASVGRRTRGPSYRSAFAWPSRGNNAGPKKDAFGVRALLPTTQDRGSHGEVFDGGVSVASESVNAAVQSEPSGSVSVARGFRRRMPHACPPSKWVAQATSPW
jgi:hypothetical protein